MNIAIVAVLLKSFCKPYIETLQDYETGEDAFEAVRNIASDEGNEEILQILDWIEEKGLIKVFFRNDCEE